MKKNNYSLISTIQSLWESKFLRNMRATLFVMILGIAQVFAVNTYSQSTRLNLNLKNASIKSILNQIENQSEFYFIYDATVVNVDRKISIESENKLIPDVLDEIFKDSGVIYKIKDRQIALSASISNFTGQQTKTVTGKVSDTSGAPLPGVTVLVKGTTQGIITDFDGKYSLTNVPADATLVFSFVGMKSQEMAVTGKSSINVTMSEETIGLEEVVAIGYGTAKKSDLTGSVVSIDMTKKQMAANVDLSQALQGYVPGVNVGGVAKAGESASISIRGQTSLSANDNPLIVLDGIIYNGALTDIDVSDIEKIDILKDASAAAVYGSRSANGVVIITTKKGKSEKPLFNFNMYYGMQEMAPSPMANLMNGDQYAIRLVDYYYYLQKLLPWYKTKPTSADARPVRPDITDRNLVSKSLRSLEEQQNYLNGYEVDWLDRVVSRAPIQSYNLSVSGKTDRTNYYLSGSYVRQEGIVQNDNFDRVTIRANFENKITDWFKLGMNTSLSRLDYSGLYNNNSTVTFDGFTNPAAMTDVLRASPLASVYDANGNYPIFLAGESYQKHPLLNQYIDDLDVANAVFLVLSAKVDIPFVKGLSYELSYSKTYNNHKQNDFFPTTTYEGTTFNNYATKNYTEEDDWLVNNIISYSRVFKEKHSVNATLLYSGEKRQSETSNMVAYGFQNPILKYNAMQLGKNQLMNSNAWEEASISYMARVNYAYNNRYMLTATYRRDGFSGFGKNNKWASFPSVSLGWIASEESFLQEISWLDYLKLRLSYGENGNQGIGRYSSLSRVTSTAYAFGNITAVGVFPETLGNANLSWESTASTNLGLDFKILDQRISAELDAYRAVTSDVLVKRSLPQTTGYDNVWTNIGGIENNGIELGLTTVNIKKPSFNWESRFVFSLNRDKITKLYGGNSDKDLGNSWFVGKPISARYDYVVEGVWQEEDLFNGTIYPNYYPGMYKLRSLNGDNVIDPTNDRKIVGYSAPNYRFSINNTLSYKNFTLSFFINSIQGGNNYYIANNYGAIVAGGTDFEYRANRPASYPYWRPDHPVNNVPAMYYSSPQGHGVYENKSFVRLQDVSLSYDFSKRSLGKLGLNSLQVYLSGKNLHTWTKWSGWDPENGSSPMMRSVIGGVRLSF